MPPDHMEHKPQPNVYSGGQKIFSWQPADDQWDAADIVLLSTLAGLSETIYLSTICDFWNLKVFTGVSFSPLLCPLCRIRIRLSSSQPGLFHIVMGLSKEFYYNTSEAYSPYSHCPFSSLFFLQAKERGRFFFFFPEKDWLWSNFVH